MEVLTDNFISNMHGPPFLLLYACVILAGYLFCNLSHHFIDSTSREMVPKIPADPDPYLIAYLRAGSRETIQLILFSLLEREYIISSTGKSSIKHKKGHPEIKNLSEVERVVFDQVKNSTKLEDVIDHKKTQEKLADVCKGSTLLKNEPELLMDQNILHRFELVRKIVTGFIIFFGGYKLTIALSKGHSNVFFLIVFGIVGAVIINHLTYLPRLTRKGRTFIKNLQLVYNSSNVKEISRLSSYQQLLLAGTVGFVLLNNNGYAFLNTFPRRSANSGSGCGSSCSGGSSCGGGGCGGCGGCGS